MKFEAQKQGDKIIFGRKKSPQELAIEDYKALKAKGRPTKLEDVVERLEKLEIILGIDAAAVK